MTLKRLMIVLGVLVFLAGVGIMWLWQYAYSPQGRARVIIAQLKDDPGTAPSSLRVWLLRHHLVRPGFSEPALDERLLNYNSRGIAAANEMAKLGRNVMPIVIEALQDKDRNVGLMAIQACGKIRDPAAIEPLAKCMYDANDPDLEIMCVDSLIEMGDPKTIPVLWKAFKDKWPENSVPNLAAVGLARMGQEEGLKYLLALLNTSDSSEQSEAAVFLAKHPVKGTLEPLLSLLGDYDDGVRHVAAQALGELRDPRAIPALRKLLNDPESHLREVAAEALQKLGDKPRPASQPGKP